MKLLVNLRRSHRRNERSTITRSARTLYQLVSPNSIWPQHCRGMLAERLSRRDPATRLTPLERALGSRNLGHARWLISLPVTLPRTGSEAAHLVLHACQPGSLELLVDALGDDARETLNSQFRNGFTVIQALLQARRFSWVWKLLDEGADPHFPDGSNVVTFLLDRRDVDGLCTLAPHPDVRATARESLGSLISHGNLSLLSVCVPSMSVKDMFTLAARGTPEMIRYFLRNVGVESLTIRFSRDNLLEHATRFTSDPAVVQILLSLKDEFYRSVPVLCMSALGIACLRGHPGLVRALLTAPLRPTDINVPDLEGKLALANAARSGSVECVSLLVSHGASPLTTEPATGMFVAEIATSSVCRPQMTEAFMDIPMASHETTRLPLLLRALENHDNDRSPLLIKGGVPSRWDNAVLLATARSKCSTVAKLLPTALPRVQSQEWRDSHPRLLLRCLRESCRVPCRETQYFFARMVDTTVAEESLERIAAEPFSAIAVGVLALRGVIRKEQAESVWERVFHAATGVRVSDDEVGPADDFSVPQISYALHAAAALRSDDALRVISRRISATVLQKLRPSQLWKPLLPHILPRLVEECPPEIFPSTLQFLADATPEDALRAMPRPRLRARFIRRWLSLRAATEPCE
jgi:hypothetical protein